MAAVVKLPNIPPQLTNSKKPGTKSTPGVNGACNLQVGMLPEKTDDTPTPCELRILYNCNRERDPISKLLTSGFHDLIVTLRTQY